MKINEIHFTIRVLIMDGTVRFATRHNEVVLTLSDTWEFTQEKGLFRAPYAHTQPLKQMLWKSTFELGIEIIFRYI